MSMSVRANEGSDQRDLVIKSRVAGGLLAAIVLALFSIANLPYQYVETESQWIGHLEMPEAGYGVFPKLPVMAGWPLRYWIRYEEAGEIQHRLWQPLRLCANLALGLLISVFVYAFMQVRQRKLIRYPDSHGLRMQFDGCLAVAIVAVPAAIFGWQYRIGYQHRQFASQLSRTGNTCIASWIPSVLEEHLPRGIKRGFTKIRKVRMFSVTPELTARIAELPSLVSFHSYRGEHGAHALRGLGEHPHFCGLLLSDCEITDEEIEIITELRWLRQLRLSGSSLNVAQLRQLDQLPLRMVDLSATSIGFDDIGNPDWSQTCERLWLSRPADGIEASLTMEGWPKLRELLVRRRSFDMNEAVLSIRLSNLPRLERLALDRVQKHDLILQDVPRLTRIDEEISDSRFTLQSDILMPGLTWVRKLEIDGADSLKHLGCFARDLEQLQIKRLPALRQLELGSYLSTVLGIATPTTVDPERCKVWIEHLGDRQGPTELKLAYLPLKEIDLSPLASNQRVRRLNLQGTGVRFDQVKQLGPMTHMESLDVRSTPLQRDDLQKLLDQFPRLEELLIDGGDLQRFDLTGRDRLRYVRVSPMTNLNDIRIVDLPHLQTSVRMTGAPETLEIRNVPALEGLSVEGPWPVGAKLEGLRDLEWFTGGGEAITDEVAQEVLKCSRIHRLTFAYPSLSRSTLRQIRKLKELIFLALPGADVDDELVREWGDVTGLWEVNLDDTRISVETIAWLSRMESLRRVSLNRVPMNDAAADAISELKQISELHLSGSPFPCEKLRPLLRSGNLETLELSGWQMDQTLIDVLHADGKTLRHLIVRDTDLDEATFQRLSDHPNEIYIEMDAVPDYLDALAVEQLHQRADQLRREMNTGWQLMLRSPHDFRPSGTRASFEQDRADRIRRRQLPAIPVSFMGQLNRQRFSPER